MHRRDFLTGTMGAALLASLPADRFAQRATPPGDGAWDTGQVRHQLPTVSDRAILLKASFRNPLTATPRLRIGTIDAVAQMTDTSGECWQFFAANLQPERRYRLTLTAANGRSLCESWELSTFPAADA